MTRQNDGKGGLAHHEGICQKHRPGEVGRRTICDCPVLVSAMHQEANWTRSNFSWGRFRADDGTLSWLQAADSISRQ
jgi:hypothetical protein